SSNKGNYIEILELVASTQPNLFNRLRSRYGHYTSHQYQNDLIHSAAEVLRESIVEEVRQAKYFSVLVDETKDVSKKEQLCLLLHYHRKGIIQERALGCFHIENLNAQSVSNLIIQEVQHLKFDVNYTVAQCYDAASVLSGHLTGVQTQIWEQIPHTIYQDLGQRILELGRLCETHWSCRYNSLQTLHARYGTVLETLEAISQLEAAKMHTAPQKLTSIFEFRNIMNELPSAYKSSLSIVDIVLSLPVPAASNERYFSVLKRVKDCLRSTMADGRLSDILLLASECEAVKDL
uniref:DUF4371 domain-containing protein n=1 Tax=Latimeria chalumnae TaxID=7897 RepID=H3A0I3_LATCH